VAFVLEGTAEPAELVRRFEESDPITLLQETIGAHQTGNPSAEYCDIAFGRVHDVLPFSSTGFAVA
jgi:hypothetical protein